MKKINNQTDQEIKKLWSKEKVNRLLQTNYDDLTKVFPDFTRRYLTQLRKSFASKVENMTVVILKDREDNKIVNDKNRINAKNKVLIEQIEALERENEALLQLKKPLNAVSIKAKGNSGTSESTAVIMLSDWHIEETVRKETVNGLNEYSLKIAEKRAVTCAQNSLKLYQMVSFDHEVPNIVVWLGGDFISGNIHEELLAACSLPPIKAILKAQELIMGFLDLLLRETKTNITVVCSSGNHSRITKKVHVSNEVGNALEYFAYSQLAQIYKKEKRLKFVIEEGYHTYVKVYDLTLRFHHGHFMKYQGGVGGITIPVKKAINEWNKAKKADIDCVGHWHQFFDGGNFIVNGSLIGHSPYGINIKAGYERPQQSFFLINSKKGKTVVAPIIVE